MRTLFLIVLVLLVLSLAGWLTVRNGPNGASINLEKETIKADADNAVEAGKETLNDVQNGADGGS